MNPYTAYALTRMQARLARRPNPDARTRLLAIGDFGHFLQSAGAAGFGDWLEHLSPASDTHAIELALRLKYRDRIDEIGRWLPKRWRPLLARLARAIDLPVLAKLVAGDSAPAWLRRDPELGSLVDENGAPVDENIRALTGCCAAKESLDACWLRAARKRLDAAAGDAGGDELLLPHVRPAPEADPDARYERRFRRAPRPPARILAFALLLRRDYEFLRGQLCLRRLKSA